MYPGIPNQRKSYRRIQPKAFNILASNLAGNDMKLMLKGGSLAKAQIILHYLHKIEDNKLTLTQDSPKQTTVYAKQ